MGEKMKFLRLTVFMAHSMHVINMYPNIKYYENICNRLRDIQQKKNRKFRNVKCWQRTSLKQKNLLIVNITNYPYDRLLYIAFSDLACRLDGISVLLSLMTENVEVFSH